MSKFIFKHKKDVMKKLPKNTELTTYFEYHSTNARSYGIFCLTNIPDGRTLLTIVHCWDDGEIMDYGYDFGEGIQRGINPLHIVRIYDKQMSRQTMQRDLDRFLKRYYKKEDQINTSLSSSEKIEILKETGHTNSEIAEMLDIKEATHVCSCDSKGSCSR